VDWAADEAALRGVPLRVVYAPLWELTPARLRSSGGPIEGAALTQDLGRPSEQVRAEDIIEGAARRAGPHPDLNRTAPY
jgi:hypothetical protein